MIDSSLSPSGLPFGHVQAVANDQWMRALAHSLVKDPNLADDVVQKTWLVALRRPATERSRGWIATVMRNMVRRHWREGQLRADVELRTDSALVAAEADETAVDEDLCATLREAVAQVSEPYQMSLRLRYFGGQSSVEIGRVFDVPAGTVRWRIKRGLQELREILDRSVNGGRESWMGSLALLLPRSKRAAATATSAGASATWAWFALAGTALLGAMWWMAHVLSGSGTSGTSISVAGVDLSPPAVSEAAKSASLAEERPEPAAAPPSVVPPTPAENAAPAAESETPTEGAPVRFRPRIEVNVRDRARNQPIQGARLLVLDGGAFRDVGSVDENGAGRVDFGDEDFAGAGFLMTEGKASFIVRAKGYVESAHYSFDRHLLVGEDTPRFMVTMVPGGVTVSGAVLTPEGGPVAGALVSVGLRRGMHQESSVDGFVSTMAAQSLTTGADGAFAFTGVPAGELVLRVVADDYVKSATMHVAEPGSDWRVEARLLRGVQARGVLMGPGGEPVAGARVFADPMATLPVVMTYGWPGFDARVSGFMKSTVSGPRGEFELRGIHRGAFRLWAVKKSSSDEGELPWIAMMDGVHQPGKPLEWFPTLAPKSPLVLEVRSDDGAPAAGMTLLVSDSAKKRPRWMRVLWTDENGLARIPDWPGRAVDVTVAAGDLGGPPLKIASGLEPDPRTGKVTVSLTEEPRVLVHGRVLDASGAPCMGAEIWFTDPSGRQAIGTEIVRPGAAFEFEVPRSATGVHVEVAGVGVVALGEVELHIGESPEFVFELPEPVELRYIVPVPHSGSPGQYQLTAHTSFGAKDDQSVAIYVGFEPPPESLMVFPGTYTLRRALQDQTPDGTLVHVFPGTGGRFYPLPGGLHVVPVHATLDGASLPARAELRVRRTGESLGNPRTEPPLQRLTDGTWLALMPAGTVAIELAVDGEPIPGAQDLKVETFGVMAPVRLAFEH